MKKILVIWVHTYNLESLKESILLFEKNTSHDRVLLDHLIIDSSIGEKDHLKKELDEFFKKIEGINVKILLCDDHAGPTSKRNLAYINNKDYDYYIELEDDFSITCNNKEWIYNAISFLDSEKYLEGNYIIDLNFGFNKNSNLGKDLNFTSLMMNKKTRDNLGLYPSQYNGYFDNPIHEMALCMTAMSYHFKSKNIKRCGFEDMFILYDICSRSKNYLKEMREHIEFNEENFNKITELSRVYFKKYTNGNLPVFFIIEDITRDICINKFMKLSNKKSHFVLLNMYRELVNSLFFSLDQIKEISNNSDKKIFYYFFNALKIENNIFYLELNNNNENLLLLIKKENNEFYKKIINLSKE